MPTIKLDISEGLNEAWESFLASNVTKELFVGPGSLGDAVIGVFLEKARRMLETKGPVRRKMDKPMRRVLPLFNETEAITPAEVELVLGMEPGRGRPLCDSWVAAGFLETDPIGRGRYVLGRDVVRETREIGHRTALWVKKRVPGPSDPC